MTYCLAIQTGEGIVAASDSRTNAGVDNISIYKKMHIFEWPGERVLILMSAGNLATTQAVLKTLKMHLSEKKPKHSLLKAKSLYEAARYIGKLNASLQAEQREMMQGQTVNLDATFILCGQIGEQPMELYLIYPQGNCISASEESPFLQIGETKYGKPILDRVINNNIKLEDAARCALVSLDSTMRSNLSVGPPVDLVIYRANSLKVERQISLRPEMPFFQALKQSWNEGINRAYHDLPLFEWEK